MFLTSLNFILLLRVVITPSIITTRSNRTKIRLVFYSPAKKSMSFSRPSTFYPRPSTLYPRPSTKTYTPQVGGLSTWSELYYFHCLPEIIFFQEIIIKQNKKFFTALAPAANTTISSLFFYCSQSTTNNDQFRVNTQDLWSFLPHQTQWSQRTVQSPDKTRIMTGEL